jgi:hypothetical protein
MKLLKSIFLLASLTVFTSVSQAADPIGVLDSADCNQITGWTCDADHFATSLSVHLYVDGAYVTQFVANGSRPDVASQCGGTTAHGFSIPTPNSIKTGSPRLLYPYAINIGTGTGNPLLTSAPRTITCAPALPIGTLRVGSDSAVPGNTVTIPITFSMSTPTVTGMEFSLTLPAGITTVSVAAGPTAIAAGKIITSTVNGSVWNFIVYGSNSHVIGSGDIAFLTLRLSPGLSPGARGLSVSNLLFADATGQAVSGIVGIGGIITVQSPPISPCDGNRDGIVNVIDIQNSVNQILQLETCTTNMNQSGACDVADTQRIINAALGGSCVTGPLPNVAASGRLASASRSGVPGSSVILPINLTATTPVATGLQFILTLPAGISTISVIPETALTSAGKTVTMHRVGPAWRFAITGTNQSVIPAGTLLSLRLGINPGTSAGTLSIPFSNIIYSNASGQFVTGLTDGGGSITVLPSTPPPPPPPSSTACDLDGNATFDAIDVQRSINQVLQQSSCTADINQNGSCDIADSQRVIRAALGSGCVAGPLSTISTSGSIVLGSTTTLAGGIVTLPVTLNTSTSVVSALQLDINLPAGVTFVAATPGSSLIAATKNSPASLSGSRLRWAIYGMNFNAIPAGPLLSIRLQVAPGTPAGNLSVPITTLVISNANGQTVTGMANTGATITVQAPPPPPPPSSTACDTDSNGVVNVIDVQRSINQTLLVESCTANINQTGTCEVADTQRIINAALGSSCVTGPLSSVAASGRISSASRSGAPGTTVTLPITLSGSVPAATGLQFTLTLPASISTISIVPQTALTSTGKNVSAVRVGSAWRFAITGLNQTVIPTGHLLYLNLRINPGTPTGTLNVPFSNIVYTNGSGRIVTGLTDGGGSITVLPSTQLSPPPPSQVSVITNAATELSAVRVYPSPWRSDVHSGHPITFSELTANATVKIFTVSGRWVKSVSSTGNQATWDLKNDSGDTVASGLYIYLITDSQGNKARGKFSVIR